MKSTKLVAALSRCPQSGRSGRSMVQNRPLVHATGVFHSIRWRHCGSGCRTVDGGCGWPLVTERRWETGDQFPNERRVGGELVGTLRKGPPWPTLDVVMRGLAGPQRSE